MAENHHELSADADERNEESSRLAAALDASSEEVMMLKTENVRG